MSVLLALACISRAPPEPPAPPPEPLFPGAGRAPIEEAWASAERCGTCHSEIAEQWAASRHARAWTNPVFHASITHSREQQWCKNCHAPLAAQQEHLANGDTRRAEEGVTCVVCHQRTGVLITASTPSEAARAVHPIRQDARLAESAFCASCHQFPFQDLHARPALVLTDEPMQNTYAEWQEMGSEARCQDCHLKGHRFPGAHDPGLLDGTVTMTLERDTPFARATVRTTGIGHAFPSGDPFRRLTLQICADESCATILEQRAFNRLYSGVMGDQWRLEADLAVYGERELPVRVPEEPCWWQLKYSYGDPALEEGLPHTEVSRIVAQGFLP